jgi:hypothetical protein
MYRDQRVDKVAIRAAEHLPTAGVDGDRPFRDHWSGSCCIHPRNCMMAVGSQGIASLSTVDRF